MVHMDQIPQNHFMWSLWPTKTTKFYQIFWLWKLIFLKGLFQIVKSIQILVGYSVWSIFMCHTLLSNYFDHICQAKNMGDIESWEYSLKATFWLWRLIILKGLFQFLKIIPILLRYPVWSISICPTTLSNYFGHNCEAKNIGGNTLFSFCLFWQLMF